MKNFRAINKWLRLAVVCLVITGCSLEPVQEEPKLIIKGAPEWVNNGSYYDTIRGAHVFYGVGSANPQGDLALQKSIADDRAHAETAKVLASFLEIVTSEFLIASRYEEDEDMVDEDVEKHLEEIADRQVKARVASQIDEAISRQFQEKVSPQFKEDVTRKIKESAKRETREAISYQAEASRQIEEIINRQIKEGVTRQMQVTAKDHLVNAKILGNWRDMRTNTIWSISELDLKSVKSTMAEIKDMNSEMKTFFEVNADKIFDRLIKERNESMNNFWK